VLGRDKVGVETCPTCSTFIDEPLAVEMVGKKDSDDFEEKIDESEVI
jgi:hypothetical protein